MCSLQQLLEFPRNFLNPQGGVRRGSPNESSLPLEASPLKGAQMLSFGWNFITDVVQCMNTCIVRAWIQSPATQTLTHKHTNPWI